MGNTNLEEAEVALSKEELGIDRVLEALYQSNKKGGLGSSSPNVNRWLGDIRKYFPTPIVQIMQKDALENLNLKQMLLEKELLESVVPDVQLAATLLTLSKALPEESKESARWVIRQVVEALEKKLRNKMRESITGSLNRLVNNRNPKLNEIDWHKTIRKNLKTYQQKEKIIIPEKLVGYGKKGRKLKHIILLQDQSGSMASSVVHAGVMAGIMASLPSIKTEMVAFDTSVVDLTSYLHDPVELLLATQLGGGTDIEKAIRYIEPLITRPTDTIVVLISDLYEGGNKNILLQRIKRIKELGVQFISLLALDDDGTPAYDREIAQALAQMDIPCFACTPMEFPDVMEAAITNRPIKKKGQGR